MISLYRDPKGKTVFESTAKSDVHLSSIDIVADDSVAILKAKVKKMEEVMQSIGINIDSFNE